MPRRSPSLTAVVPSGQSTGAVHRVILVSSTSCASQKCLIPNVPILAEYTSFSRDILGSLDSNDRRHVAIRTFGGFEEEGFMRAIRKKITGKQWARFALKWGLLLTDAELWASLNEQLREGANEVSHVVKRRYEKAADRLQERRTSTSTGWASPTVTFLGGVGLGIGLGVMFAPVSGDEARAALRDKVVDIRNKVSGVAV